MTQMRKLPAKPEVVFYRKPDDRPLWLRHCIRNRHNHLNVMIFKCRGLDRYDEGIRYLAHLTEAQVALSVIQNVLPPETASVTLD